VTAATKAPATASTVGLRASWFCAACSGATTTHQITMLIPEMVDGLSAVVLDPPEGWTVRGGATFCPEHRRRKRA